MKVDLLRQLDEWGTHFEARIEHVEAETLVRNASETREDAGTGSRSAWHEKWNWHIPIRVAGVAALVLVLAVPIVRFMGREVSQEFDSVGAVIGGGDFPRSPQQARPSTPASGVATTAPPTTQAPTIAA